MQILVLTIAVLFCAVAVSAETKKPSICTVCQYNTAGTKAANKWDPRDGKTLRDSQKECKEDPEKMLQIQCTNITHACVHYKTTVSTGDEESITVLRGCQARADCNEIDNKLKVKTGDTKVEVTCGASGLPMSVLIGLMSMLGSIYYLL